MSTFAAKEAWALHEGSLHICSELRVFLVIRNQNGKDEPIKRPANWGATVNDRQYGNTRPKPAITYTRVSVDYSGAG